MKKILFIIPCVPYPLNSGGNQAFFQMVDYIRHKMSVSVLFYAWTIDEEKRVEKLEDLWEDVDFYTFVKETKEEPDSPLVRNPFYYKWLKKLKMSIERKMRRQLLLAVAIGIEGQERFEEKEDEGRVLTVNPADVIHNPAEIIDKLVALVK